MATVSGFITIADVQDGNAGYQAILVNENQTLAAGQDGAITSFSFTTATQAFAGLTELTYANTLSPTAAQYSIATGSTAGDGAISFSAGAGLTASISSSGIITISDGSGATGFANAGAIDNAIITVPFRVRTESGSFLTINRAITLSKARGGSAEFVTVSSTSQIVTYDAGATTPQSSNGNIVFTASAPNITTGTTTWSYFVGSPSTTSTFTPVSAGSASTQQGVIADATTTVSTLTTTPTQFNSLIGTTNTQVVFRATRAGQTDQVTVVRLREGARGANSANVVITVTAGTQTFRNNQGTATLRADTFVGGVDVSTQATGYQWMQDGTNISGATSRTLSVAASDVADDGASLYSCQVTFPDSLL